MKFHLRNLALLSIAGAFAILPLHAAELGTAEDAYFGDLPIVLSVTRLAQSLQDTPGAVTVIDREMIRKTGAREVAELLRLVPGFVVSYIENGGHPIASYHAALDEFGGRHMQVFVDGRSVYSSLYVGDTHRGLMGVILDDIERIEVLRGSNSAAYGANAFLGVINIVTRNAADTQGTYLAHTGGNQGVSDYVARLGWGSPEASFRLTAARTRDEGAATIRDTDDLRRIPAQKDIEKLHFRADLRPSADDEVLVTAGQHINRHGRGELPGDDGNPARVERMRASYAQFRWNRQMGATESIALSATVDEEDYRDAFDLPTGLGLPFSPTIRVGYTGFSRRYGMEFQHTASPLANLRTVWGLGLRHEMVRSELLFTTNGKRHTQSQKRLFGNIEWRLAPAWLLNVGGLYESHSAIGGDFLPRLMLNFQPMPEHTFRAGVTKATRTPSLFELNADVRLIDPNTGTEFVDPDRIIASGNLRPERVTAHELGYLMHLPRFGLNLDVRVFREYIRDLIDFQNLPTLRDLSNQHAVNTRGVEYQLRWRPYEDGQLILNHTQTRLLSDNEDMVLRAPRNNVSLVWMQRLPGGADLTLMHSRVGRYSLNREQDMLDAYSHNSVRVGYPFRIGQNKAEVAVVTQGISGSHVENQGEVLVKRRTFATLRLEF